MRFFDEIFGSRTPYKKLYRKHFVINVSSMFFIWNKVTFAKLRDHASALSALPDILDVAESSVSSHHRHVLLLYHHTFQEYESNSYLTYVRTCCALLFSTCQASILCSLSTETKDYTKCSFH